MASTKSTISGVTTRIASVRPPSHVRVAIDSYVAPVIPFARRCASWNASCANASGDTPSRFTSFEPKPGKVSARVAVASS
jgi:hypothetical protein